MLDEISGNAMVWGIATSGIFSLGICLLAGPLGRALRIMDVPDKVRHLHQNPTPMTGGFSVILPTILASLFFAVSTDFMPFFTSLAAVILVSFGLGLADDRGHIHPLFRLLLSAGVVLTLMIVVPATSVTFFHFTFMKVALFLAGGWGVGFTVVSIVGLQNSLNMADGKNGLAVGLCLIWVVLLLLYSPSHLVPLLAAMLAALVVTAVFNITGRLFLGDSGTYSLSVSIGVLTVYVYNVNFSVLHADVVALWFLIPVVDALRLIFYRIMAGRSPFTSDTIHFHHLLERLMPWRWGLILYLTLVAAPALAALVAPDLTVLWAVLVMAVYGSVVVANHWDTDARRMRLRLSREG